MSYVMVPVPEDQVANVMQFVVRLMSQASIEPWTEESVAQLFDESDEPGRALLSVVARSALGGSPITERDAATAIEMSWRETMGIQRELNDIASAESRPVLITRRVVSETLPNGRTRDVRVLTMGDELARLVHAADRAHLLADGQPLGADNA